MTARDEKYPSPACGVSVPGLAGEAAVLLKASEGSAICAGAGSAEAGLLKPLLSKKGTDGMPRETCAAAAIRSRYALLIPSGSGRDGVKDGRCSQGDDASTAATADWMAS